jgi:hypothetical protein
VNRETDLRPKLNADRRRQFGETGRTLALLCECGDADCHRTVLLTATAYDALAGGPVIHPEHLAPLPPEPPPPDAYAG